MPCVSGCTAECDADTGDWAWWGVSSVCSDGEISDGNACVVEVVALVVEANSLIVCSIVECMCVSVECNAVLCV